MKVSHCITLQFKSENSSSEHPCMIHSHGNGCAAILGKTRRNLEVERPRQKYYIPWAWASRAAQAWLPTAQTISYLTFSRPLALGAWFGAPHISQQKQAPITRWLQILCFSRCRLSLFTHGFGVRSCTRAWRARAWRLPRGWVRRQRSQRALNRLQRDLLAYSAFSRTFPRLPECCR